MRQSDSHAITGAAIRKARANDKYTDAQIGAGTVGFTIEATPRRTDDPATLTIPADHPVPQQLLEQLVDLAAYLRCRALDGHCTPIAIHLRPKPRHAPN